MKRVLLLVLLMFTLVSIRTGRRPSGPPRPAPDQPLGEVQLSPHNHLFVRGHEITGTVTAEYRDGACLINGLVWSEHCSIADARALFHGLSLYVTSPYVTIAIYNEYGSLEAGGRPWDGRLIVRDGRVFVPATTDSAGVLTCFVFTGADERAD